MFLSPPAASFLTKHLFLNSSVTRWLDQMFNIWPFTKMEMSRQHNKLAKVGATLKKFQRILPGWRNFAKSVHSVSHFVVLSRLNDPTKASLRHEIKTLFKKMCNRAGALVQWLWEEIHVPKAVSLNPSTIYWLDIFSHLFVVKLQCVFEKTKIHEKGREGPF